MTYGYPGAARWNYEELLDERLGVELDAIAGCVVDDGITGRADGYNTVTRAHLEARYGRGILDRLWSEAGSRLADDRAVR